MSFNGNSGGVRSIRAPTADEIDFTPIATLVQKLVSSGGNTPMTISDINIIRNSSATYDSEYDLGEYIITDVQDMVGSCELECLNPSIGIISGRRLQRVSNGTATILYKTPWLTKQVRVPITRTGGSTVDTLSNYVTGSLGKAIYDSTKAKATNHSLTQFSTLNGPSQFIRNNSNWVSAVDFTGVSPYNTYSGTSFSATAISPRHLLLSWHASFPVGTVVYFIKADNSIVSRTVTGVQPLTGTFSVDSAVLLLDSDLPPGIAIYKIFPSTVWANKLPTTSTINIPGVAFNQQKIVSTRKIRSDQSGGLNIIWAFPYASGEDSDFIANTGTTISGDSSSPLFLLVGNEPVLLGTWTTAVHGTDISQHITQLNAAMTTLGGGYTATQIDLSSYNSY